VKRRDEGRTRCAEDAAKKSCCHHAADPGDRAIQTRCRARMLWINRPKDGRRKRRYGSRHANGDDQDRRQDRRPISCAGPDSEKKKKSAGHDERSN
jgi:hypothetical protein